MMCTNVFNAAARARIRLLCLAALLALIGLRPSMAATLTVGSSSYPTIASAVAAAQNGDTVLVPDGTYTGPGNVDVDFGGKAITVQSVNGPAATIIDCAGTLNAPHGAFLFQHGEGPSSALQGFTIENANQISNINNNAAGAVYVSGADPTISQCNFVNNSGVTGGAIFIQDGNPAITQCVFTGNDATTGSNFSNGGAVEISAYYTSDTPVVEDCTFVGNAADGDGGAIDLQGSGASEAGVGLVNCSFFGNSASGDGSTTDANDEPGTIDFYGGQAAMDNCIFYGDTSAAEISTLDPPDSLATQTSDIGQAGYAGAFGDIDADPEYVNPTSGNLHLQNGSPCTGAGTMAGAPAIDLDGASWGAAISMGAYAGPVIAPAPTATQIVVTAPATATAAATVMVTVTACDAQGNPVTGYSGTVAFSSTDWQATLPAPATLTNGTGTFSVTFALAGSQTLTASDTANDLTGTSGTVVVSAGAASQYVFTTPPPATATAGTAFTAHLAAEDTDGNIATSYSGTAQLTSSDSHATLPASVAFTNGVSGLVSVTLKTAGTQIITATDAANALSLASDGITVTPAAAAQLVLSAPATASAGVAGSFTVTARDAYGNTATGDSGHVAFSSTDSRAALPPVSALTAGHGTFPMTFWTGGMQTMTATDAATASLSGTSAPVTVSKAAAAVTLAASLNPATAGQSLMFTATVGASVAATPTGTVTFAIDGVAQPPVALANGAAALSTSSLTAGSYSITAAYSGDTTFQSASTATALTENVTQPVVVANAAPAATTTTLSSSNANSLQGQSVTLTVTVSTATGAPTGSVTVSNGSTVVGTAALNGAGTATISTTTLPAGTDSLTASYAGNATFAVSASAALAQTVHAALHTFAPGLQMIAVSENYSNVPLSDAWTAPSGQQADTWSGGPAYLTQTALPAPGQAAWTRLAASATVYDTGAATPTGTPFAIPLQQGWNMIGNPFTSAIAESSLLVQTPQNTTSFAGGETAVYATLYSYPAGASAYVAQGLSGSLEPYQGYWMYAYAPCTLLVPASSAAVAARL